MQHMLVSRGLAETSWMASQIKSSGRSSSWLQNTMFSSRQSVKLESAAGPGRGAWRRIASHRGSAPGGPCIVGDWCQTSWRAISAAHCAHL